MTADAGSEKSSLAEYRRKRNFGCTPEPSGEERWGLPKGSVTAAAVPGAVPAELPPSLTPQLASLAEAPVAGDEWLHEIEYNGYRVLCRIDAGTVELFSRKGKAITGALPRIQAAMLDFPVTTAWVDGEIVVFRPDGTASFSALQAARRSGTDTAITYLLFDIMYLDGLDLRPAPLHERKRLLAALVPDSNTVRYSDHITGRGDEVYAEACANRLEGVVSKRADAPYVPGRSRFWLKLKCGEN